MCPSRSIVTLFRSVQPRSYLGAETPFYSALTVPVRARLRLAPPYRLPALRLDWREACVWFREFPHGLEGNDDI